MHVLYSPLGAQAAGCQKPVRRQIARALAACATSPFLVLSSLRQPVHLRHPLAQEDEKNLPFRLLLSLFTFPSGRGGGPLAQCKIFGLNIVCKKNQPVM